MINVFKNFQTSLNDYLSYLKNENWCLDNTLYEDVEGITLVSDLNTNYDSWKKMYYKTYTDINNNNTSLKCNGEIINKFSDNTDMYVSTLTASEVLMSGINSTNYLMNSFSLENNLDGENPYKGINFWTLSPAYFDGLRSYAYSVNSSGDLTETDLLASDVVFRPSIVLESNTKVIKGDGSKENPYTITEEQNETEIIE